VYTKSHIIYYSDTFRHSVTIIREPCLTVNLQLDWDTLGSLMLVAMNAEGQQSSN